LKTPESYIVDHILQLAKQGMGVQIYMSFWVINEVIAVIDRKIKSESDKQVLISTILKVITDVRSNIVMVPIDQRIVDDAIHYIRKYHLSADDALHVCVADIVGCDYLLTTDKHYKRAQMTGLQIVYMVDKQEVAQFLKNI
jgi:predicted nucleic acid-binding protein